MTEQERIERAYRLAFPGLEPPWRPTPTAEKAWKDATAILHIDPAEAFREPALNHAILALALLPEGGGTLGRWTVHNFAQQRDCSNAWAIHDGLGSGAEKGRHASAWWHHTMAPGAYLDGAAAELLLLMCAADELVRREVQP